MASYRTVRLSELTRGSVLAAPIFDENFKKLLSAGASVSQQFVSRLQSRGITEVLIECDPATSASNGARAIADTTQPIQRCGDCRSIIEIGAPNPELAATIWRCNECGAIYFGSDKQENELRGLTRADRSTTNPFALAAGANVASPMVPPESSQRLAEYLLQEASWAAHRRRKRHPVTALVVALPLASDYRATGEPISMTTRNVSLGGAALIHTRFLDAPNLAIDFSAAGVERLQVVFKVLQCKALGPMYEISGQFVSRLSH